MAYARDCSDEEIDRALEAAGFRVRLSASEGIDTMVGDRESCFLEVREHGLV